MNLYFVFILIVAALRIVAFIQLIALVTKGQQAGRMRPCDNYSKNIALNIWLFKQFVLGVYAFCPLLLQVYI
jgi:hypothetical protein